MAGEHPAVDGGGHRQVEWLTGGRVGRPHGLDGSFHVTRPRPALLALGARVRVAERETEIVRRAGTDDRPILRLAGFDSRAAAEDLRGEELWVPRAAAPSLGEGEWWAEDLEGCRVVDSQPPAAAGTGAQPPAAAVTRGEAVVGTVRRLLALPSCDALEVERPGGGEVLIPLVSEAIRTVDVDARVIDVRLAFLGETAPEDMAAERER